jgi:ribosomal protein L11 methyltransferase
LASDEWVAIRVETGADRQQVIDALFSAGSQGVQEDGNAIVTHFPASADIGSIEQAIHRADPRASVTVSNAPQVNWDEWRANVREHTLGRVTVAPPWLTDQVRNDVVIVIDPAMAFGTGEHATTRGVIRLMQQIGMPDVVADLGAGSAILSICAARLGAQRVIAIELDADAIGNAEDNVVSNNVDTVVRVTEGDAALLLPLVAPVGLVLANIISSVLLELLNVISDSLDAHGNAILSGILVEEREMMERAIGESGFEILSDDTEEGWWSVLLALRQ